MRQVNPPEPVIRPALPNEAELLSALALRSKAHWGYSTEFLNACREELSHSPEQIASSDFVFQVSEIAGAIVGFYALKRLSDMEVELDALFIAPEHIGQGIGRALMEHALRTAVAHGAMSLVTQSDPFAESFYQAAGGVRTGMRESGSIPGRYLPVLKFTLASSDVA